MIKSLTRLFCATLLAASLGLHSEITAAAPDAAKGAEPCTVEEAHAGSANKGHDHHGQAQGGCITALDCPVTFSVPESAVPDDNYDPRIASLKRYHNSAFGEAQRLEIPPPRS